MGKNQALTLLHSIEDEEVSLLTFLVIFLLTIWKFHIINLKHTDFPVLPGMFSHLCDTSPINKRKKKLVGEGLFVSSLMLS